MSTMTGYFPGSLSGQPVSYTDGGGTDYSLVYGGSGYASDYLHYVPTSSLRTPISSSMPAPVAVAASTGTNPTETSYALYGHTVPLSVFGVGRIGGEIIAGPWVENGRASFIISFGMPADPSGTRTLREIAFDSEVVWDSTNGFRTEAFTYRFYGGSLTQAADALETSHFGADAVAYRPQMLIAFENLPLANTKFGKIPYVAAVIADASGDDVNLGEAFERLAYSPWVGWTSSQFETSGITDGLVSGGLIIAQDTEFLSLIQQFARFYPRWDVLQTDKLRIVDRGATVTADIVLDKTRLVDQIVVSRQGRDRVRQNLELSTISPDADYTIVPSTARLPSEPVAVTTSVGKDTAYLPAIMEASTRTAIVTFAKYHEEAARKTISGTAMAFGLQIEPGALVKIRDIGDDFNNETFRVLETLHGANCVVEFTAEAILKCALVDAYTNFDPATAINATVTNSNLTATGVTPGRGGVFVVVSTSKSSGKYYFEITWVSVGGFLFGGEIGVASTTATVTDLNSSVNSAMLFQGPDFTVGQIWSNGTYSGYSLGAISSGDVIGIAVDLDHGEAWFRNVTHAGAWNGPAAAGDPSTNSNGVSIPAGEVIPAVGFGVNNDTYTANFGATDFMGAVPSGFIPGWA